MRRPLLDILPLKSPLQAVLLVPTRAIGFVRPGQKVRLLYEAFPFQRFGAYSGHVESVSKTILSEADTGSPLQLKEPSYNSSPRSIVPTSTPMVKRFHFRSACCFAPTFCSSAASSCAGSWTRF